MSPRLPEGTKRLHANMGPNTTARLQRLQDQSGKTYTQIIAEAIRAYDVLDKAVTDGCEINLVNRKTRTVSRVHLV